MSLLDQSKVVSLRCEDCAEVISLIRHNLNNGDVDYEIVVEDAYCGGDYRGFFGRVRRAWCAFWAKPVSYTGVYIEGKERVRAFLEECMQLIEDETNDGQDSKCIVRDNEQALNLTGVSSGCEFAEQILADLIANDLSGDELLEEFNKRHALVRPAVEVIIAEVGNVVRGKGECSTYDDVFGAEEGG